MHIPCISGNFIKKKKKQLIFINNNHVVKCVCNFVSI